MVYLKSLRLQNFQAHVDTTFEFSPYFNCIVGCTRSSKSSVVRALDFLFYNEWLSDYQRFDTPRAIITATLNNDIVIIRTKSKTENKLVIQTPTEKKEFEGFGVNLPREYIEIISIFPFEVDTDVSIRTNVANQDDPLFLIYDTGTIRTKVFSRLSGLHWIDYALKDLNKDKRNNSSNLQTLKEDTKNLKESLKNFNVENLISQINKVKEKFNTIKEKSELITKLENLINKTTKWKAEYQRLQQLKISFADLPRFEKALFLYDNYIKKMFDFRNRYTILETSQHNLFKYLQNTKDAVCSIEKTIVNELTNNPTCATCGSRIDYETFIKVGC